jgi:MinD superfamily P-loop ATPase
MKLAVASGKGGTGKTTVSVSLALAAKMSVQFLDCDVEEPNAHIFLNPVIEGKKRCTLIVPKVIENKCTYCGKCRDICRFNAITVFDQTIMTFPELCHSCGGCFLVCPENALAETEREIGFVEKGHANGITFVQGILRICEAMSPPLIKAVKKEAEDSSKHLVILDSPPGTSCPVIETVSDADYILLVTEPTPFGLYDLKLAAGMLRKIGRPFGVIINRSDLGNKEVDIWCGNENIPIHMRIPFDRKIAEGYARGEPLITSRPDLRHHFESLLEELVQ